MDRRVFYSTSAGGPWTQHQDQSDLPVVVNGLSNGVPLFFKGVNVDTETGLVSAESKTVQATPNSVPGSKPGEGNTGPSGMLARYEGPMTIDQDGTLIENVIFEGSGNGSATLFINANNVRIRNFKFKGYGDPSQPAKDAADVINPTAAPSYAFQATQGKTGIIIEDGDISFVRSCGIYGSGLTASRLNIHLTGNDGFKMYTDGLPTVIEDCWMHHMGLEPLSHADCVQARGGGNCSMYRNNFDIPKSVEGTLCVEPGINGWNDPNGAPHVPPTYKSNACFIGNNYSYGLYNLVFDGNWMEGGNNTIYVEAKYDPAQGNPWPTNVTIINNWFGPDHNGLLLQQTSSGRTVPASAFTRMGNKMFDGTPVDLCVGSNPANPHCMGY